MHRTPRQDRTQEQTVTTTQSPDPSSLLQHRDLGSGEHRNVYPSLSISETVHLLPSRLPLLLSSLLPVLRRLWDRAPVHRRCPQLECGCVHDRDVNAARNLKRMAVSYTASACGEVVSLDQAVKQSSVKQELNSISA
jgi:hypothetical protein